MFAGFLDTFFIAILLSIVRNAASNNDVKYVDMVCSTVDLADSDKKLIFAAMIVMSPRSIIRHASFANSSVFDTNNYDTLRIITGNKSVKFLPTGIKKFFPKLIALNTHNCGLTHLERNDMRQFGNDITYAHFGRNLLTALEDDLFKFNPNLMSIYLSENPLKYINPELFYNLKQMARITRVDFENSKCISEKTRSFPDNFTFDATNCSDQTARNENLRIIGERHEFFMVEYPDDHCTNCNGTSIEPSYESFNCTDGCVTVTNNFSGERNKL